MNVARISGDHTRWSDMMSAYHRSQDCSRQRRSFDAYRRRGRALALIVGVVLGNGCYVYRATAIPDLEPGEPIRVTLSETGSRATLPDAPDARRLEGRFTDATADSLALSVWIGAAYRGTPFETTYQHVALPRIDVVVVEDRQLSKGRTGLVVAGTVALIVTLIDRLGVYPLFEGDGSEGLPLPPEPGGVFFRR